MKMAAQYLRSFFISLEFVVILVSSYLFLEQENRLIHVLSLLAINAEAVKYLALLPAGILVWNVTILRKIRFPERDKKYQLQNWPSYFKLQIVLDVALIYSIIFSILGALSWITPSAFPSETVFLIQMTSLVGSAIVALSCLGAELTINEIFS